MQELYYIQLPAFFVCICMIFIKIVLLRSHQLALFLLLLWWFRWELTVGIYWADTDF